MRFVLEESRRLTGPNLWMETCGAIIEANIYDFNINDFIEIWSIYAKRLLHDVGWTDEKLFPKPFTEGANLVFTAPLDALYAATEINDYAYELTVQRIEKGSAEIDPIKVHQLKEEISHEVNPKLMELRKAAEYHKVTLLSDDDEVSIGLGKGSETFDVNQIPKPNKIKWKAIHDIPVAVVTGTNGKSTTVRITYEILKASGKTVGTTSTDFIKVGDEIIDTGDYSGPGGARAILRNKKVEAAVLEVARGGILRRGLSVHKADAVCVTNIAADHLGQYGINTVEELAEAKFVVTKLIDGANYVVLNADDHYVIDQAMRLRKNMFWISTDPTNELVQSSGCYLNGKDIEYRFKGKHETLINVDDMAFTFGGAAKHNVYNAMAAIGITKMMGLDDDTIRNGLKSFKSDTDDNPGRTNFFKINGATVIVDFAHNEHGMNAIISMGKTIDAKRKLIMVGHAGDRTDHDVEVLCKAAYQIEPDCVVIAEVPEYLRGRDPGELPRLFQKEFLKFGMDREQIIKAKNSVAAVEKALEWMKKGDLLLLMVLNNKEEILKKLSELQAQ
jgi:cyanophycin synthetase